MECTAQPRRRPRARRATPRTRCSTSPRCSISRGASTTSTKAGAAYSRLARCQRRKFGKYDVAMDHLRRAHELFERSRDDRGIASTLDDMGRVNWLRGGYSARRSTSIARRSRFAARSATVDRSRCRSRTSVACTTTAGNFKAAMAQSVPRGARSAPRHRRPRRDRAIARAISAACTPRTATSKLALEMLGEARARWRMDIGDKLALADVLSRSGEVKGAMGRQGSGSRHRPLQQAKADRIGPRRSRRSSHSRISASRQVQLSARKPRGKQTSKRTRRSRSAKRSGLRVHIGSGYRVKARSRR